jgi:hypothetical protein
LNHAFIPKLTVVYYYSGSLIFHFDFINRKKKSVVVGMMILFITVLFSRFFEEMQKCILFSELCSFYRDISGTWAPCPPVAIPVRCSSFFAPCHVYHDAHPVPGPDFHEGKGIRPWTRSF